MPKSVSESIERSVAETTPTDSDWFWPNGLPIAATGSPTWTSVSEPSESGCMSRPSGSTLISATSANGSKPTTCGGDLVAVGELDVDLVRLVQRPRRGARRRGVGDHVGVGEDLAVLGDHEARALPGPTAAAEDRRAAVAEDRDHGDHARRRVLVDRAGVEGGAVLGLDDDPLGAGRGDGRRGGHHALRVPVAAAAGDERGREQRRAGQRPDADGGAQAAHRRGGGQPQLELGRAAPVAELERPAHADRELLRDREPEARAADLVAGVEALEDPLARAGVDARAVIGDDQAHGAVWVHRVCGCLGPYLDRRSLRRVSENVVDEDTHDLRDPVRVGDRGRTGAVGDRDLGPVSIGRRPELGGDPSRHVGEPNRLAPHLDRVGVELGEVEEVDGELRQPVDLLAHRPDELRPRLRVRVVLLEQLDEAGQRRDRGAQLVRGVGDELLAGAVEHRETLLHLVERDRELADLVGGVDRDRVREVAVGDLLGRRLEPAQAARVRARDQPARRQRREQRDPPGDQDLAADQGDVVLDVGEIRGEDRDPARLSRPARGRRRSPPARTPPTRSTALAIGPAAVAAEAAG